jgi:hypothetical protein
MVQPFLYHVLHALLKRTKNQTKQLHKAQIKPNFEQLNIKLLVYEPCKKG